MCYVHKMHHKYLIYTVYTCMHAQCNMSLKYFTEMSDAFYKGKAQKHKDQLS